MMALADPSYLEGCAFRRETCTYKSNRIAQYSTVLYCAVLRLLQLTRDISYFVHDTTWGVTRQYLLYYTILYICHIANAIQVPVCVGQHCFAATNNYILERNSADTITA